MSEQTCCNKNKSEQFTCGQLRLEIDCLKWEAFNREARIMMYINQVSDLEQQLAEARAEIERLNSVDHYACALCPDIKQSRQEAARGILHIISMETMDRPFEQSQAAEIIKAKFKLEG